MPKCLALAAGRHSRTDGRRLKGADELGTRTDEVWRKQAALNVRQEILRDALRRIMTHGEPGSRTVARLALEQDRRWAEGLEG